MSAQATVPARTAATRAAAARNRPVIPLPQPLRKAVLVVHVATSVSWLGLSLGLLTLAATALATGDMDLRRGTYLAADVFGGMLVPVVSLTAFTSGVVLALGTRWGLVRHRWVLVKFVLTLVPVVLTFVSLRPGLAALGTAATTLSDAELAVFGSSADAVNMVVAPSVASTMYLTSTILSVTKPWGRTRWGRRAASRG